MKSSLLCVFLLFGFTLADQPGIYLPFDTYSDPNPLVFNGEDAPDGAFPYMVSLNRKKSRSHMCGGSVLTKYWGLTAAHCCEPMEEMEFYALVGTNVLSKNGSAHDVESFKIHPKYSPQNSWVYDICVFKVKQPFEFGERVAQVTVPPMNWPVNDNDLVNVTGWGLTSTADSKATDVLQLGKNYVALSRKHCRQVTNHDHESYLCVRGGSKGQGVCSGDSGSPAVKNGVQVGVASFVFFPCGRGKPDFYSRVPASMDFIEKALGSEAAELKRLE